MSRDTRRYAASPITPFRCDHCGSLLKAIVVDREPGTVAEMCVVRSMTAARRVANALNLYRPRRRYRGSTKGRLLT